MFQEVHHSLRIQNHSNKLQHTYNIITRAMDQKWKFQAPQFVAFNNLGANENSTADEFFNVDIENGEHRVETLVETTKVKDGKGQTRPTITIPESFKLCTKFIAGEREQFEFYQIMIIILVLSEPNSTITK